MGVYLMMKGQIVYKKQYLDVAPTKSYIEIPTSLSPYVFMVFYEEEHSPISIGTSGDISLDGKC